MDPAWLKTAQSHGPETVFLGVAAETVMIPIPSPPFIIGAGALLIPQQLTWQAAFLPILFRIALPGAVGTTLATTLTFGLCYWGGKPLIDRWRSWLGFDWEGVLRFEKRFAGRWNSMIFVARALPVFPTAPVSAAAGVIRLPWTPFVVWTFAGSVIRCLMLGYIGFLTRGAYETAAAKVTGLQAALTAAGIALAAALVVWVHRRHKTGR